MQPNERPWAEHGNATADEIFVVVGKALSRWEMVEHAVASLFTVVTVGNYHAPTDPMLRAYAAVLGSNNRIQMVEAALQSWLLSWPQCPLGPNAIDILKRCKAWAGRRNDVAHGLVDLLLDDTRWYLFPSLYAGKGRKLIANPQGKPLIRPDYRYNAKIVDAFSDEFLALFNELNQITSALATWYQIASGGGAKS